VIRVLPVLLELCLVVYCLIDCIQSDELAVRNLPRTIWILLILFFPIVGGVAWLVAGRPTSISSTPYVSGYPEYRRAPLGGRGGQTAPDDDDAFLHELGQVNQEHERTLKKWEADLSRREQELRRRDQEPPKV
jgi:hypothetical protein